MNLFTRITATLGANADSAVSRFENHDAIAQSALTQARQALTKAKIQHNHVRKSGDELRSRLQQAQTQTDQWTARARNLAQKDESKALECLAHRQACRELVTALTQELSKHEAMEEGLNDKLATMQKRMDALNSQRNEMRSRESIAKATSVLDRVDSQSQDGVDAIFERWEVSISDTELHNAIQQDVVPTKPSLQRELEGQERQTALKDELAILMADNAGQTHE